MYINNEDFEMWMDKLSKKLNDIGADLKSLINTKEVFDEDEKLLDNQDLAFLLKVSYRTLQRYRTSKKLPFFMAIFANFRGPGISVCMAFKAGCTNVGSGEWKS